MVIVVFSVRITVEKRAMAKQRLRTLAPDSCPAKEVREHPGWSGRVRKRVIGGFEVCHPTKESN